MLAWTAAPRATTSSGFQFGVACGRKTPDHAADQRDARGAANEDNFLDVGRLELRIGEPRLLLLLSLLFS